MELERNFIMRKGVDWSLLNEGMTIPVSVCALLRSWNKNILTHGHTMDIKVYIDGQQYDATLRNQNFEQANWPGHNDVIQIRYSKNSPLALKLREVFYMTYDYLYNQRVVLGRRGRIQLPEELHEYIRLYLVDSLNMIYFECCSNQDYAQLAPTLNKIPEEIYEANDDDKFFMTDTTASIVERQLLVKYRKMDRSIIRMLKKFYDYKDEISGEKIGSEYGDSVVEAHHIEYFTASQNNDSTNIIIISPNYHRIIHKNNPHFNRNKFQFEFSNGEILKLKLYDHLITKA
jgi:hypothetical protein